MAEGSVGIEQEIISKKPLKEKFNNFLGQVRSRFPSRKAPEIQQPTPSPTENLQPTDAPKIEEKEVESPSAKIYTGLERLDEIMENEPLLKSNLQHREDPKSREFLIEKIKEIENERKEIFTKYGIDKLLDKERIDYREKYKQELPDIKDAKSISRLLIHQASIELPQVKPGYVRMYRGEGPHPGTTQDADQGMWFGLDLTIASSYPIGKLGTSRIIYVDVPETKLAEYHINNNPKFFGGSKVGEYHIPREIIPQSKEMVRFLKADVVDDPWKLVQMNKNAA